MAEARPPLDGTTTTTRLEAFSDGVFAIAVTLLVLEIKTPHTSEGGLARALAAQWPSYVAYAISFAQIGIIWANHHAVMDHVRRADRGLLLATLFLLMGVSFIPFPTAVLADHLADAAGPDRTVAALLFGGAYVWMALAFNLLWRYIRRAELLHDPAHPGVQAITGSFRFGPLIYLAIMLLALVSVSASVAASAALAVYWALPRSTGTVRARPGGAPHGGAPRGGAPAAALAALALGGGLACAGRGGPVVGPPVGGAPFDRSVLAGAADPWRTLPAPFWTAQPAPDARGASLRGVRAVSDRVAWASGSGGTVLRTTDGGQTWVRRPVAGADALDFRSVWAFDSLTAVVASAGEAAEGQARIYRTTDGGRSWTLARRDSTRGVFYDAVAFWDRQYGLVLSDPVGEGAARHFLVLATRDGGATWYATPAAGMPAALEGEAAFAAGNAALGTVDDTRAWFVTGGPNGARVYTTTTGGARWDAVAAPVTPRGASAGLFAVAGAPGGGGSTVRANLRERTLRPLPAPALAVGGDYRQARTGAGQIARSGDGDRWERADPGATAPGYWSGLAYVPGLAGTAVAVGGGGTAVTRDDGRTWAVVDSAQWNAVSFTSAGAGWGVGPDGRIGRVKR